MDTSEEVIIVTDIFIIIVILFIILAVSLFIFVIISCVCNIFFIRGNTDEEDTGITNLDFSDYTIPIENNDDDCVICFDDLDEQYKVKMKNCDHVYHNGCINKWLNIKQTCPCCRISIYENIELIV